MISIITPCLNILKDNRLDYFEKMMKSVHNQTYINLEHIIVDGGSTDGTLEILKKYKKAGWINQFISEKDSGIYSAANKGIKLSKGEYILIMNTDDFFIDLNYFVKSIEILENKEFDFIHADRIIKSRRGKSDYIKKGEEKVAYFRMPFRHQTLIVKRNIFNEIGFFDEKYQIASDYKFVLQMLLPGKKGYHFNKIVLSSLGGGISSNREKCIQEVSQVLYETYGHKNGLTVSDCKAIYKREISPILHKKILIKIKNKKIINSLELCYQQSKKF